jgi:hypothetical protein
MSANRRLNQRNARADVPRRGSCDIRAAGGDVATRNGRRHATEDPLPRDPGAAAQLQVLDLDEMRASVVRRDDYRLGGCEARVTRDQDVVTDLVAVGCSIRRAIGLRFEHTTEATRPTESRRRTRLRRCVRARGGTHRSVDTSWPSGGGTSHVPSATSLRRGDLNRVRGRLRHLKPATPDAVRQSAPACRSGRA